MNTARIMVLAIAIGAGGIAAYLASGPIRNPSPRHRSLKLETVDVLIASPTFRSARPSSPNDLQWQTWPAADCQREFHSPRPTRPNAIDRTHRLDRALAVLRRRADPRSQADQGQRLRLHGGDPAVGHARDLDRNLAGNRRRRLHPAERSRRRDPVAAATGMRRSGGRGGHISEIILTKCACSRSTRRSRRRTARRSWSARPRRSS